VPQKLEAPASFCFGFEKIRLQIRRNDHG
jgi:hypothetical protein